MKFKLSKGDKIGIFSPSSPITATAPGRFARAKKYLQDKGFVIVEGVELENMIFIVRGISKRE